jgi:hypothetical protein
MKECAHNQIYLPIEDPPILDMNILICIIIIMSVILAAIL